MVNVKSRENQFNDPGRRNNDPLMQDYLDAALWEDANRELARLMDAYVTPCIKRVLFCRLSRGTYLSRHDTQDFISECQARIVARLISLRNGKSAGIHNLGCYSRRLAINTWHRLMRDRNPDRSLLADRLHYLMKHHNEFVQWTTTDGKAVVGLPTWYRDGVRYLHSSRHKLLEYHPELAWHEAEKEVPSIPGLSGQIVMLLRWVAHPCERNALMNAVVTTVQTRDLRWLTLEELDTTTTQVAEVPRSLELQVENKLSLQFIWTHLSQLALPERTAILLNLRDNSGQGVMDLLVNTGTASYTDIAGLLGIELNELLRFWNVLPLDDLTIASIQGVSRQQVINRRKEARRKLQRLLSMSYN